MIRGIVGVSGAIIFYFLLRRQIIAISAPDFDKLSFVETPVRSLLGYGEVTVLLPSKDWALLVIWSILAGFSEKLVPNSLAKAQATADKK